MKTNRTIFVIAALIGIIGACKEKEIYRDSPEITVSSPARNAVINDSASVNVEAVIRPKDKSVVYYHIRLLDAMKRAVYDKKTTCNCMGETKIDVKQSVEYDVSKTSDLMFELQAILEDGTSIQEEVPFKLMDVKK